MIKKEDFLDKTGGFQLYATAKILYLKEENLIPSGSMVISNNLLFKAKNIFSYKKGKFAKIQDPRNIL